MAWQHDLFHFTTINVNCYHDHQWNSNLLVEGTLSLLCNHLINVSVGRSRLASNHVRGFTMQDWLTANFRFTSNAGNRADYTTCTYERHDNEIHGIFNYGWYKLANLSCRGCFCAWKPERSSVTRSRFHTWRFSQPSQLMVASVWGGKSILPKQSPSWIWWFIRPVLFNNSRHILLVSHYSVLFTKIFD